MEELLDSKGVFTSNCVEKLNGFLEKDFYQKINN